MGFSRDLPLSFKEALRVSAEILTRNHNLVERNLLSVEAEQIVVAAQRKLDDQFSRLELHSRIEDRIQPGVAEQILVWSTMRSEGKPLQHLTGVQFFLNHEYLVGPDALVPRPETEILVDTVIKSLTSSGERPPQLGFEIGLGSGVISIELLSHFKELKMIGTEFSSKAHQLAKRNAKWILSEEDATRLEAIWVVTGDSVLDAFKSYAKADFIVSNPPYLASTDEIDDDVLNHEPEAALFPLTGGPNYFYEKIASQAHSFLKPHGMVFLEIPHNRAEQIDRLFKANGWKTQLHLDLTQRQRVLVVKKG